MIRDDFLPFSKPSITEDDIAATADVLRSGWITTGPKCEQFEKEFGAYVGSAGAVALASATGGMHLILKALNIGPGDEVITPSMTWVSTPNMISLAGARPVFVDVDRDTLMVSTDQVEAALTPSTKLVIPVHYAGASVDLEPMKKLAEKKGFVLLEDAAHAIGTEYQGRRIGANGTTIFSFHPIKNITTGEGGMVCSDDEKLLDKLRCLKFHGLGVDAYDRQMQGRAPQSQVLEPGFKYNLTDIGACLGIGQLRRIDEMNRKRAEIARYYQLRFREIEEILPLAEPSYEQKHSWHLFIVRLDTECAGMTRDQFMRELKQRGIGAGLHFRAVHLQKYYAETLNLGPGLLPNTEWNSDRICSLPLFPDMTEDDADDVIDAIKDILAPV